MRYLQSITAITKVFETNQKPVLVLCEDFEHYVCKHNHGRRPAYALFCEWLAWQLLNELGVQTAPYCGVSVLEEHILPRTECQPAFFKSTTCFATLQLSDTIEVTHFPLDKKDLRRIRNGTDLLKIAFLDLLLANDDRHQSNYNLLLKSTEAGYFIVPIDHENMLNGRSFSVDRQLFSEDYFSTLMASDFFRAVLSGKVKNIAEVEQLFQEYYLCVKAFIEQLHEKVALLPTDWHIPMNYIHCLRDNLVHPNWIHETKTNYLSFIRSSLRIT